MCACYILPVVVGCLVTSLSVVQPPAHAMCACYILPGVVGCLVTSLSVVQPPAHTMCALLYIAWCGRLPSYQSVCCSAPSTYNVCIVIYCLVWSVA